MASQTQRQRLRRVYEYVPTAIGQKFKYVNVDPGWKAADIRHTVDLLTQAGILSQVCHCDGAMPLGATTRSDVFKPLFLDVGLMNAACGVRNLPVGSFSTGRFVHEGAMAEQFIGQHLRQAHGYGFRPSLHYWLREGKRTNAEVDYLIQLNTEIIPVEVKAGASGSLKSLQQFAAIQKPPVALRFDLNPPSVQQIRQEVIAEGALRTTVEYTLVSLPMYMVECAHRILSGILEQRGSGV